MTSQSAERIGGWLLAPLAWLLVALLSASLSLLFFANALMSPQTYTLLRAMSAGHMALWVASLLFALAMWYYTLWLTIAFFKRRSVVPKHYIIWLLITLLLAIKAFAFSPVSDVLALRQLLFPLLAAALLAGIGVAAEYAHFIPEWVMLVLFLLAFFLYGYCIKRAWKVARFIKRVKRRMRRNNGNNPTLTK